MSCRHQSMDTCKPGFCHHYWELIVCYPSCVFLMMIQVSVLAQCKRECCFAGFTAAKKTIIQNWFTTPHMCRKTYWIRSLLQIVTCECATARVGGARPSTVDAWQCFLFDIRDCIKEWLCVFIVLPSLPPFWLDFEMLSMCLLFCFVIFWMLCCVMCEKKNIFSSNLCICKYLGRIALIQYEKVFANNFACIMWHISEWNMIFSENK